jgi:hypothetical protein
MNHLLANQVDTELAPPVRDARLASESQLRIGAGTLSGAAVDDITATTVVGVLGADNIRGFEALVADIADEFDLDANVRFHVGSFSVRFSRRPAATYELPPPASSSSNRLLDFLAWHRQPARDAHAMAHQDQQPD